MVVVGGGRVGGVESMTDGDVVDSTVDGIERVVVDGGVDR